MKYLSETLPVFARHSCCCQVLCIEQLKHFTHDVIAKKPLNRCLHRLQNTMKGLHGSWRAFTVGFGCW